MGYRYDGRNRGSRTQAGCGTLFGVVVGFGVWMYFFPESRGMGAVCIVGGAVICALLAYFYGDDFWENPPHLP